MIVIRQVIIHYSECKHMTKSGGLKFMSLVATSDPILAVLKPYQGLYNSHHWLWGNLVTRLGI